MIFKSTQPSVLMLGSWQPWHAGHTKLFKKALTITGQVVIMIKNIEGIDRENNPLDLTEVRKIIIKALDDEGYEYRKEYICINVPNIVDISFGKNVGYTFTEHDA